MHCVDNKVITVIALIIARHRYRLHKYKRKVIGAREAAPVTEDRNMNRPRKRAQLQEFDSNDSVGKGRAIKRRKNRVLLDQRNRWLHQVYLQQNGPDIGLAPRGQALQAVEQHQPVYANMGEQHHKPKIAQESVMQQTKQETDARQPKISVTTRAPIKHSLNGELQSQMPTLNASRLQELAA